VLGFDAQGLSKNISEALATRERLCRRRFRVPQLGCTSFDRSSAARLVRRILDGSFGAPAPERWMLMRWMPTRFTNPQLRCQALLALGASTPQSGRRDLEGFLNLSRIGRIASRFPQMDLNNRYSVECFT
jgi:hypothetical protein